MRMHSNITEEHAQKAYDDWRYVKTADDVRAHYKKWFPYFPDAMIEAIIVVLDRKRLHPEEDDLYVAP